jgi:hypothetical protein
MKMTIFRTVNYRWRLLTLKSGRPYIKREMTRKGFDKFMKGEISLWQD